jgi:hypothetical protein
MSNVQKDWLSKWAPLVVAIITNLILVAYSYGKLEQRLAPIEKHQDRSSTDFVTRNEFTQRTETRDREMADLKQSLRDMNVKLDRLLER